MCEKFHIPYDVAGVTLLAFGNGAPDVFSSIAAFSSGAQHTAINALLGAGVFVTTVVVGVVVLSTHAHASARAFVRDCSAYLTALVLLVVVTHSSEIGMNQAVSLPILYAIYVGIVIIGDLIAYCAHRTTAKAENDDVGTVMSAFWHDEKPSETNIKRTRYAFVTRSDALREGDEGSSFEMSEPVVSEAGASFSSQLLSDYFPSVELSSPLISQTELEYDSQGLMRSGSSASSLGSPRHAGNQVWQSLYVSHMRWKRSTKRRIVESWRSEPSALNRFILVLHAPFVILRDLTIPVLEKDAWSRLLATIFPLSSPFFILLVSDCLTYTLAVPVLGSMHAWIVAVLFGLPISVFIFFTTHRSRPPKQWLHAVGFLSLAFFSCIAWVYSIASEVVALLASIGFLTGINPSIMGLTVLAWGNSLGDLITNVSVAKAGFSQMAIAGCFGGPLFNLLIGLGASLVYYVKDTDHPRVILDGHAIVAMTTLFLTLPITLAVLVKHSFRFPRRYGFVLLGFYAIYSCINIIMEIL